MKKKIIVMTVSKQFMKDHPRAGEDTGFVEKILSGQKLHTIRHGTYWRDVTIKVNTGTHYLSLRTWDGTPYNSKQTEFMQVHEMAWQEIIIDARHLKNTVSIDGTNIKGVARILNTIALNDGLDRDDFNAWFKIARTYPGKGSYGCYWKPQVTTAGIIHFTNLWY